MSILKKKINGLKEEKENKIKELAGLISVTLKSSNDYYYLYQTLATKFPSVASLEPYFKYMSFEDRYKAFESYKRFSNFPLNSYEDYMRSLAKSVLLKISIEKIDSSYDVIISNYKDYPTIKKYLFPYISVEHRKLVCNICEKYHEVKATKVIDEIDNIKTTVEEENNNPKRKIHRIEGDEIRKYLLKEYDNFDNIRVKLFPYFPNTDAAEDEVRYIIDQFKRYDDKPDEIPTYETFENNVLNDRYNDFFQSFDEYNDELSERVNFEIDSKRALNEDDNSIYMYLLNTYIKFEDIQTYLYPDISIDTRDYIESIHRRFIHTNNNNGRTR